MNRLVLLILLACLLGCLPEKGGSTALPSGTVVAFAGAQIPTGWTLCDGSTTPTGMKTPDLRGRFVMGASGLGAQEIGGSKSHAHAAQMGDAEGDRVGVDKDKNFFIPTRAHSHPVTVQESEHLPPYQTLVYLMKD
jgi:microcystin-dependent protein